MTGGKFIAVGVTKIIRLNFLAGCVCLGLAANLFADTNFPPPDSTNSDTQNALLQIQEQLRATQLAISDIRVRDEAEAASNTAVLTARIQSLEQTVASQHTGEMDFVHKAQQQTLILAGAFALVGVGALLVIFYFQWRAFSQFSEISATKLALQSSGTSLIGPANQLASALSAPARAAVETSNMRLLTLVERLEKRVGEVEQSARGALPPPPVSSGQHDFAPGSRPAASVPAAQNGHHGPRLRIANLLADGQTLLNADQPENALKLFEEALALSPDNPDALIKKAGALEKLNRADEAIACYNRAIEMDESATMAWLQKGGLFNRMARYDEAMQCYEKALRAQEKTA